MDEKGWMEKVGHVGSRRARGGAGARRRALARLAWPQMSVPAATAGISFEGVPSPAWVTART